MPETTPDDLDQRVDRLGDRLLEIAPVAVALSGGVDSSLLLFEAVRVLGPDAIAVTGVSASLSKDELEHARIVAEFVGVELLEIATRELDESKYRANRGDRCFHCKHELYSRVHDHPELRGRTVIDGTHAEDPATDRPGMRAASQLGVVAPLRDVGFGKDSIRRLAKRRGLPNWDRPARPCLASRVAVGTEVTTSVLADIEALESILARHDFRVFRARVQGERVVVELGPPEVGRLEETAWRREFSDEAAARGYREVLANPEGYGRSAQPIPLRESVRRE